MGEFHDAVSHLLQAFVRGLSIIKTQRGRRKKNKILIDSKAKSAETHLSKTLKHNSIAVQDAYAEAHSSLSFILLRLNAGFVSVIERFTRGPSTPSDYETLLSLSNASRQEAIDAFSLLSQRLYLSRPSLAPAPPNPNSYTPQGHRRRRKSSNTKATEYPKHARSKIAPKLSVTATPLGLATPEGWVRAKVGIKAGRGENRSSGSRTRSGSSTPKHPPPRPRSPPPPPSPAVRPSSPPSHHKPQSKLHFLPPPYRPTQHSYFTSPTSSQAVQSSSSPSSPAKKPHQLPPIPPQTTSTSRQPQPQPPTPLQRNRKSIMSFASDSTKLGEIPAHKWARHGMLEAGQFPIPTCYPLEPYREPERPRSRLRKLFRR